MTLSSNWPAALDLTDAHHEEPEPRTFPAWLLARAESIILHQFGRLPDDDFEGAVRLLADHIADEASSRRFNSGGCLVWTCETLAAGPFDLFCHEHGAIQIGDELPAPYGMDSTSTDDPHRPVIVMDNEEPRDELIAYTDRDGIRQTYTVTAQTPDQITTHEWESDHIGRFTR